MRERGIERKMTGEREKRKKRKGVDVRVLFSADGKKRTRIWVGVYIRGESFHSLYKAMCRGMFVLVIMSIGHQQHWSN